jgi:uncharacterized protein YndB with AHSA1/START domain/uncharacterized protein YciI
MMKPKRSARAIADVGAGTILATVEIAAPPERVFAALTSPDELVKWWGTAETYRTTAWTSDLKVGGRWRADGTGANGPFSVEGEFIEIDPPRKLVCTWKPTWDAGTATTLTYRLEAIEGGTRVVVRHEGFSDRADSCRGHAQGWEQVLEWLRAHAAPEPAPLFYMLRLLPPRPTFMLDMTEDERAMMRDHVAYWARHLASGKAIVFGPVGGPAGGFGLGVLRVADEAELHALQEGDPAIRAGRGLTYEISPMVRAVVGSLA